MKLDRRSLRAHLDRMGGALVPPPSPDFAVRTAERLRSQHPVSVVTDELAVARARRRPPLLAAAAAAAAVIALVLSTPRGEENVTLTTDGRATSTAPESTTTTVGRTTTTSRLPQGAATRPTTTTTTTPPAVAVRPRPTTTTTPLRVPTPTTEPTSPPRTDQVTTTTTTKVPTIARLAMRCTVGWSESVPFITCTWAGTDDPSFAGWRLHKAAGTDAKRTVWTSADASVHSYSDRAVVPGTTYQYAIEAFAAGGQTIAKGGIVTVACCPP